MDTQIQLGSFVFKDLEIPQDINFGGMQQLVKHDLIGGNRTVDALGQNDMNISWSGLMLGPDALPRAQQLNQMRVSGQLLNLKWFNLSYKVVIENFIARTERYYQIAYEITLMVISDGANPINNQGLVGFNEAIQGDLKTANTLAGNVNNSSVNSTMALLTTAIQAVTTFNGASSSTIASVFTPLTNAISAVQTAITPIAKRLFGTSK